MMTQYEFRLLNNYINNNDPIYCYYSDVMVKGYSDPTLTNPKSPNPTPPSYVNLIMVIEFSIWVALSVRSC